MTSAIRGPRPEIISGPFTGHSFVNLREAMASAANGPTSRELIAGDPEAQIFQAVTSLLQDTERSKNIPSVGNYAWHILQGQTIKANVEFRILNESASHDSGQQSGDKELGRHFAALTYDTHPIHGLSSYAHSVPHLSGAIHVYDGGYIAAWQHINMAGQGFEDVELIARQLGVWQERSGAEVDLSRITEGLQWLAAQATSTVQLAEEKAL